MKTEIVDGETFYSFFYNVAFEDTFDSDLAREFRGIVFNDKGECVARPFHKFFNINENEYTHINTLRQYEDGYFLPCDKLDGSLIYPIMVNGNVKLRSKKSFYSDVAKNAQKYIDNTDDGQKLISHIKSYFNCGMTPMFEYISPDNRIVINYRKEELKLLACRNTIDGTYGVQFNNPTFKLSKLDSFIEETREREGIEGYVLYHYIDGEVRDILKIKTKWYLVRHRLKSNILFKNVFDSVESGSVDDIVSIYKSLEMYDEYNEYKTKVSVIQDRFHKTYKQIKNVYEGICETYPDIVTDDKKFALLIKDMGIEYTGLIFSYRKGMDITSGIFKMLRRVYKSDKELWLS
ncbi:RNA ligase [uncultured Arcobacter sp.]|uniref:RNA ligase n=1 Tax=uncultured Arcobacter sp. TaxID=165434 RepID=UPI002636BED9|nr:RNA ligase [uncultured Arcobacter sp.]